MQEKKAEQQKEGKKKRRNKDRKEKERKIVLDTERYSNERIQGRNYRGMGTFLLEQCPKICLGPDPTKHSLLLMEHLRLTQKLKLAFSQVYFQWKRSSPLPSWKIGSMRENILDLLLTNTWNDSRNCSLCARARCWWLFGQAEDYLLFTAIVPTCSDKQ